MAKPRSGTEVPEYIPDDYIPLVYEALNIVGKAMFKRRWRKAEKAYADYEETTRRGGPNPKAAKDQAVWQFRLCRKAIKQLRDFLCGRLPDSRGALRALFLPDNSRRKPIKIDPWIWRAGGALGLFRTPQLYYDEESGKLWPKSRRNYERSREPVEGRIIVSKRDLMRRVALEFPDAASGQPASKVATAATREQEEAAVEQDSIIWLTERLRQSKDLTMTREDWWAEVQARFPVGPSALERRIWPVAASHPDTAHWRRHGRKRKSTQKSKQ
jgi:hypothetical protein